MRQMVNGRLVDVPTEHDGSFNSNNLRRAAGVPANRPLILQLPDGTNQLINYGEKVNVQPGQYFMDAPAHTRGNRR